MVVWSAICGATVVVRLISSINKPGSSGSTRFLSRSPFRYAKRGMSAHLLSRCSIIFCQIMSPHGGGLPNVLEPRVTMHITFLQPSAETVWALYNSFRKETSRLLPAQSTHAL